MNIKDKIKLSQVPVVLFHEGNFLKMYNESLFVVKRYFIQDLKITSKEFSNIRQKVIYGGIPVNSIYKRFPHATKTGFGYQVCNQSWDLTQYQIWFERHSKLDSLKNDNQTQPLFIHQQKSLTQNQLTFLANWRMEDSSAVENCHFIQQVKDDLGL